MVKKVLTITDSDPLAFSGIQRDLRDFQELNVFGFTVITALTSASQNKTSIIEVIETNVIKEQLESVFAIGSIDAIKIAQLYSSEDVKIVKDFVTNFSVKHIVCEIDLANKQNDLVEELLSFANIVVLKNKKSINDQSLEELYNSKTTDLLLIEDPLRKTQIAFNGEKKLALTNPTNINLGTFLTAELAKKNSLNHLLT